MIFNISGFFITVSIAIFKGLQMFIISTISYILNKKVRKKMPWIDWNLRLLIITTIINTFSKINTFAYINSFVIQHLLNLILKKKKKKKIHQYDLSFAFLQFNNQSYLNIIPSNIFFRIQAKSQ